MEKVACPGAGEVPRETGSETRPPCCLLGCRERQACSRYRPKADDPGGLPRAEAAALYCRPINKLPSNWQNGSPAACLFLPREPRLLFSWGLPGRSRLRGPGREGALGYSLRAGLGLGERAWLQPPPYPPSEPEPSGRDLSGGVGYQSGKEEVAIPGLTGPRCHFFFPVARHR